MLKVLDVDGAVRRVQGGWTATGQPWSYDTDRYAQVDADRRAEQQAMRDYVTTSGCRMEYLRRQLDDPDAAACGRCDNCRARPLDTTVSPPALDAAQAALGRPGIVLEPRKMWPSGIEGLKGRIPAADQAAPGRALGRLSDLGWGTRLRELLRAPDQEVPPDLVAAVVKVLAAWDWEQRPTAVVALPSRSRPRLVGSLAARLADLGRLSPLGTLELVGSPAQAGSNSAQRARSVHGAFGVPPSWELAGERVLLVDDRTDSGWTLTEAARLLRRAGAAAVLPLVLGLDG
jgi:ATP-dependent DNA helicase RecQ